MKFFKKSSIIDYYLKNDIIFYKIQNINFKNKSNYQKLGIFIYQLNKIDNLLKVLYSDALFNKINSISFEINLKIPNNYILFISLINKSEEIIEKIKKDIDEILKSISLNENIKIFEKVELENIYLSIINIDNSSKTKIIESTIERHNNIFFIKNKDIEPNTIKNYFFLISLNFDINFLISKNLEILIQLFQIANINGNIIININKKGKYFILHSYYFTITNDVNDIEIKVKEILNLPKIKNEFFPLKLPKILLRRYYNNNYIKFNLELYYYLKQIETENISKLYNKNNELNIKDLNINLNEKNFEYKLDNIIQDDLKDIEEYLKQLNSINIKKIKENIFCIDGKVIIIIIRFEFNRIIIKEIINYLSNNYQYIIFLFSRKEILNRFIEKTKFNISNFKYIKIFLNINDLKIFLKYIINIL